MLRNKSGEKGCCEDRCRRKQRGCEPAGDKLNVVSAVRVGEETAASIVGVAGGVVVSVLRRPNRSLTKHVSGTFTSSPHYFMATHINGSM